MNTPVKFEIKKLLFNKGWKYKLSESFNPNRGLIVNHSLAEQRWNEGDLTYVDITIAEVVIWLYEKHGIWIMVKHLSKTNWMYDIQNGIFSTHAEEKFDSPTEAYEAAIEYILTKLL